MSTHIALSFPSFEDRSTIYARIFFLGPESISLRDWKSHQTVLKIHPQLSTILAQDGLICITEKQLDVFTMNESPSRFNEDYAELAREAVYHQAKNTLRFCFSRGVQPNKDDKKKEGLMHLAAQDSFFNMVDMIIQAGGSVNVTDDVGNTPLHHASLFSDDVMINKLIKAGARTDVLNKNGFLPSEVIGRFEDSPLSKIEGRPFVS